MAYQGLLDDERSLSHRLYGVWMVFVTNTYSIRYQICQFALRFAYVSGSARLHQPTSKVRIVTFLVVLI